MLCKYFAERRAAMNGNLTETERQMLFGALRFIQGFNGG
jgi:hypothetical protein